MANQHVNKVVLSNGTTLIDLTNDDVKASDVLSGIKFHLPSGAEGTGACTYDADTSDATATAAEILNTKTAYKNGAKVIGTMPNRGGVTGTISDKAGTYTIQQGYHDGSGKVSIAATEQAKIIATNIREGITILGVEGTMSGSEDMSAQSKTVTPTFAAQTITPDTGYNCLAQVTVNAIPVAYSDNAAGGQTCTIG